MKRVKRGLALMKVCRPEIWNAARCTDPCSCHHHNPLVFLFLDALCNVLKSLLFRAPTTFPKYSSRLTTEKASPDVNRRITLNFFWFI